jgi:biopolymer transport protein ExbD
MNMKKIIEGGRRRMESELDMAPLIDMIFILLIFFLVATSFSRESGVELKRPKQAPEQQDARKKTNVTVVIGHDNRVFIEDRVYDVRNVRAYMENFLLDVPKGTVVIATDKDSYIGRVIQVMDQCKLAGVENVSVAPRIETK